MVNSQGIEFIAQLKSMIAEYQPDMVWIDPLLCYLGGDPNSSEDVSHFTGLLDELAIESKCLFHLIHHTGKPKTSQDTKGFTNADLMYAGLGSSVLTNWARAIMVLQAERGSEGVYRLTAAKRGKRAGMHHDYSTSSDHIHLEHSDRGLCWLASDYQPEEKKPGRKATEVPFTAFKDSIENTHGKQSKAGLARHLADEYGMSQRNMERRINNLIDNKTIKYGNEGGLVWIGGATE